MGEMKMGLRQQFFDPEMAARKFYQVSDDVLKTDKQDVTSRWYDGVARLFHGDARSMERQIVYQSQ